MFRFDFERKTWDGCLRVRGQLTVADALELAALLQRFAPGLRQLRLEFAEGQPQAEELLAKSLALLGNEVKSIVVLETSSERRP